MHIVRYYMGIVYVRNARKIIGGTYYAEKHNIGNGDFERTGEAYKTLENRFYRGVCGSYRWPYYWERRCWQMKISEMQDRLEDLQNELLIISETATAIETSLNEGNLTSSQIGWALIGVIRSIDKSAKILKTL